jgi:hypothetical protein
MSGLVDKSRKQAAVEQFAAVSKLVPRVSIRAAVTQEVSE